VNLTLEQFKAIEKREAMDRVKPDSVGPHEHKDSGWRCLVNHGPGAPQCFKCEACNEWVSGYRIMGDIRPLPCRPDLWEPR